MTDHHSQQHAASQSSTFVDEPTPPTINYWHVWTDRDGVSHQSRCQIQDFKLKSIAPPASPQWMGQLKQDDATIVFAVLPVGWIGAWHENPKPQWVIPLSGRWFVETMDGQRVEMGSGEISFGEDQNTKADAQGHKGHLSGTVGDEPAVLMIVQFDETPTVGQSCRFR
ncbi:MAG: cupin domain-containing protein [Microcystaceae cyanobacterium]